MKHLKRFNEKLGVADAVEIYNQFVKEQFIILFKEWSDNGINTKNINKLYKKEDLKDITNNKVWANYPVSELEIDFEFKRYSNDEFSYIYPISSKTRDFAITGGCYNLEDNGRDTGESYLLGPINNMSDKSIHLKMDIAIYICEKFNDIDYALDEIESLISHELNHAYEGWNRKIKNSPKFSLNVALTSLDNKRKRVHKKIKDIWYQLEYVVYATEPHEINALVQEAWPYVRKYDFEYMKSKSVAWKISQSMVDFKVDIFKDDFSKAVKSVYPDADPNFFLKYLKTTFCNKLIELNSSTKDYQDKSTLDGEKLKGLLVDDFLKLVQDRVNTNGLIAQKKIIRLYSRR